MNESERMTYLIIEAIKKCEKLGHRMDWRRYSNKVADAECIRCKATVDIYMSSLRFKTFGRALTDKCKGGNR